MPKISEEKKKFLESIGIDINNLPPEFEKHSDTMENTFSREEIAASLTCHGVSKSGSPTPNDIAFSIMFATSKNFLMPELGIFFILSDKYLFIIKISNTSLLN